jgi:hypothetical protein
MAKHASSTSKIVTLIVLCLLGWGFWNVSPLFLPRYRWTKVKFEDIARESTAKGMPTTAAKLSTQFDIRFAYNPRGNGDPAPWILLSMSPKWSDFMGNPDLDEEGVMKRCHIVSDRTGEPITGYLLGSGQYKDFFFKAKAWRFPPGSLGHADERPVVLFEAMSLEKFDIGEAQVYSNALRDPHQWQPDDDGWEPTAP